MDKRKNLPHPPKREKEEKKEDWGWRGGRYRKRQVGISDPCKMQNRLFFLLSFAFSSEMIDKEGEDS